MKKIVILLICLLSITEVSYATVVMDDVNVNMELDPSLEIYPNPVTAGQILIELDGVSLRLKTSISITNLIGQVIYKTPVSSDELMSGKVAIDISNKNISKGIYFVKLVNGNRTAIKKLVVK